MCLLVEWLRKKRGSHLAFAAKAPAAPVLALSAGESSDPFFAAFNAVAPAAPVPALSVGESSDPFFAAFAAIATVADVQ